MKKLKLKLDNKALLSKDQMRKINGGYDGDGYNTYVCCCPIGDGLETYAGGCNVYQGYFTEIYEDIYAWCEGGSASPTESDPIVCY